MGTYICTYEKMHFPIFFSPNFKSVFDLIFFIDKTCVLKGLYIVHKICWKNGFLTTSKPLQKNRITFSDTKSTYCGYVTPSDVLCEDEEVVGGNKGRRKV